MLIVEWVAENSNEFRLVVAFMAAAVAFLAILSHRRTTARKTTLDFILNRELHDPSWLDLRLRVFPILNEQSRWERLIDTPSNPEKQDVFAWLNHHEIIAVGISHRALDRDLYFNWLEQTYRDDWELACDFVSTFRRQAKKNKVAFVEFQRLATSPPRETDWSQKLIKIFDLLLYVFAALTALFSLLLFFLV